MGNSSTASSSSQTQTNFSLNHSGDLPFNFDGPYFFWDIISVDVNLVDIVSHCHVGAEFTVWLGLKVFILATALPSNAALMWLLLKNRSSMSPSQVLGLNICVMDVLHCFALPFDIYATIHETSPSTQDIREALSVLNIFGCPLLLTFMCLERYIAAAFPLTYLLLGKREYRIALCVLAWILTLVVGLFLYFFQAFTMILSLAVIITVLFLIMLYCLVGIVWILRQNGPGDGANNNDSLKKRALKNILMVMAPSVVAYCPLVAAVPYLAVIKSKNTQEFTAEQCTVLQILLVFPNFGLYIGPMFYLSRLRQMICCKNKNESTISRTQAE